MSGPRLSTIILSTMLLELRGAGRRCRRRTGSPCPASWPAGDLRRQRLALLDHPPHLAAQRERRRTAPGTISLNRNIVPTSRGFSVLMKVPPLEMFFV